MRILDPRQGWRPKPLYSRLRGADALQAKPVTLPSGRTSRHHPAPILALFQRPRLSFAPRVAGQAKYVRHRIARLAAMGPARGCEAIERYPRSTRLCRIIAQPQQRIRPPNRDLGLTRLRVRFGRKAGLPWRRLEVRSPPRAAI